MEESAVAGWLEWLKSMGSRAATVITVLSAVTGLAKPIGQALGLLSP